MSIRKIFTVARNEINTLFYSPIAWVMLALFAVLTGIDYIARIDIFLRNDELGGSYAAQIQYMSRTILIGEYSVFYSAVDRMYIFLPLLTMGLISRELSSGTIKLLYSSPLRIREIVLGKYVAIVAFVMCMTVISIMLVVALDFSITNPDIPQLIASLTGLFLIMCCYAALGLFISSLTTYQVVAAIVTCVILGFLKTSNQYFQNIEFIRNITFYLDINDKSETFLSGLVNLRDFCYFLILIGTFLVLTIVKLKSGTVSISRWRSAAQYGSVLLIAFIVGYVTSRKDVNVYLDTTRGKDYTISKPTQDLLKQMDDHEFDLTLYVNILHEKNYFTTPQREIFIDNNIIEPYYRFKPNINLRFVYYYYADSTDYRFRLNPEKSLAEIAESEATLRRINFERVLSPEEVGKLIDVKSEEYNTFFHLQYGNEQLIVRTFNDPSFWPSEYEFAAAWLRLKRASPKVMFLSGEMERSPFGKRSHNYRETVSAKRERYSLLNQGFDVDTLSLRGQDIPKDITALVIADPRLPLSTQKIEKVNRYIDEGGNLLLLTEPDSWQNAGPILEKLGITIKPGMIIHPNKYYSSDIVFSNVTDTARNLSPFFMKTVNDQEKYYGDTVVTIKMPTVSALAYKPVDGFTVEPLLVTDCRYSWNRIAPIQQDSLVRGTIGKAPGDEQNDFITSVRMYRNVNGKEQRIIVASDADYLSEGGLKGSKYGFQYQLWCYRYFSYGKNPTMTLRPGSIDNDFVISHEGVFIQRVLFCWILPALLAITGIIILIRRKRK